MIPSDYPAFHVAWINAHAKSSSNQVPADSVVMDVFDDLSEFPLDVVLMAIRQHSRSSRYAPTPFDVIDKIPKSTAFEHVGPDEAWAIALESFDEFSTVVWTREIAEAKAIAQPVFDSGDAIGARMAFKDAYSRLIRSGCRPVWSVTVGYDAARREQAVSEAVLLGRLPAGMDSGYRLESPSVSVADLAVKALEKQPETVDRETVLSWIDRMRSAVAENDFAEGVAQREQARKEFESHRQAVLERIDERMH